MVPSGQWSDVGVSVYTNQPRRAELNNVAVCGAARPVTATNTSVTGLVCEIRDRERSGDMVRIQIDLLSSEGPNWPSV